MEIDVSRYTDRDAALHHLNAFSKLLRHAELRGMEWQ